MNRIITLSEAVLMMEQYLKGIFSNDNETAQAKKLWENTFIKHQLDKRACGYSFSISDHIRAMVYSMLSSGASWARLENSIDINTGQITAIDKIFHQYSLEYLSECNPQKLTDEILKCHCGSQYTAKQMSAVISSNIKKLTEFEQQYGSIDEYYSVFIKEDSTCKSLIKALSYSDSKDKLAQMGIALTAEYLRNVGYDIAKPDRHIRRILGSERLACSDNVIVPAFEAFDIVTQIAECLHRPKAEIDYILWSYCAKGYGEICTAKNPKCNKCTMLKICKRS